MADFVNIPWTELFKSSEPVDFTLTANVLKKRGEPFLILPTDFSLARKALALYPAQSRLARLAKKILSLALKFKLGTGLEKNSVSLSRKSSLPRLISSLAGNSGDQFPAIAILCGNARVAGRRFVLLIFAQSGEPTFVLKAGIGEAGRRLIQDELSFLRSAPKQVRGLPVIRAQFDGSTMAGFAMPFIPGDSPRGASWDIIGGILTSWIDPNHRVQIETTEMFRALEAQPPKHPAYPALLSRLHDFELHPVLFHGDFAPWNIKANGNDWTVLDWERGKPIGVAAWDWFHYVTMTGILLEKLPIELLVKKLETLLEDPAFKKYAVASGITGKEHEILLAYLFYLVEVIQPTEGIDTARNLSAALCQRWLK